MQHRAQCQHCTFNSLLEDTGEAHCIQYVTSRFSFHQALAFVCLVVVFKIIPYSTVSLPPSFHHRHLFHVNIHGEGSLAWPASITWRISLRSSLYIESGLRPIGGVRAEVLRSQKITGPISDCVIMCSPLPTMLRTNTADSNELTTSTASQQS